MKQIFLRTCILTSFLFLYSCNKENLSFSSGDIQIEIKAGENWLHNFPLFLGLKKKNPPQFALWIEDSNGNYVSTIFATYKIATQAWIANKGNRRKESLPHWCYQRGVVYDDGLNLPTRKSPLTDGITGATPKGNKVLKLESKNLEKPFIIKAEFNHSIDFNAAFPKNAKKGTPNYSGGAEGSGQPAIVYSIIVDETMQSNAFKLIGYSSPNGSSGKIYTDIDKLTSAKSIVENITLKIIQNEGK